MLNVWGSQVPGELGSPCLLSLPILSLPTLLKGFSKYVGRREWGRLSLQVFPQLGFSQLLTVLGAFWVGKFLVGEDRLAHLASLDSRHQMLVCNNQKQVRNAPVHFQTPLWGMERPWLETVESWWCQNNRYCPGGGRLWSTVSSFLRVHLQSQIQGMWRKPPTAQDPSCDYWVPVCKLLAKCRG